MSTHREKEAGFFAIGAKRADKVQTTRPHPGSNHIVRWSKKGSYLTNSLPGFEPGRERPVHHVSKVSGDHFAILVANVLTQAVAIG
jgi:hypothetical protein